MWSSWILVKVNFFLPQIDKNNLFSLVFLTVQIFVLGTFFTTDTIRFHVFTEMFISSYIVNTLLTEGKFIMATLINLYFPNSTILPSFSFSL